MKKIIIILKKTEHTWRVKSSDREVTSVKALLENTNNLKRKKDNN